MDKIQKTVGPITKARHNKLHARLKKKYGKASKCEAEGCTSKNPKRYEWALKKGHSYSGNIDDYMQMCPSCHRKYDFTEQQRERERESHKGQANNRAKLSEKDILNIYDLLLDLIPQKDIAAAYNVNPSTISDIARGKRWPHLWIIYKTLKND